MDVVEMQRYNEEIIPQNLIFYFIKPLGIILQRLFCSVRIFIIN
jgi:hypothetical protein